MANLTSNMHYTSNHHPFPSFLGGGWEVAFLLSFAAARWVPAYLVYASLLFLYYLRW
jgi:hypothetical protein